MKPINRREFAKLAAGAALAVPLAPMGSGLAWPQEPPKKPEPPTAPVKPAEPPPQAETTKPESKLKLSEEQEEAVKKAVERRDRQLAALRNRALRYDAEPAFVFQVRLRPRAGRR